jgi:peptide/nickel transport system substrate-binding protein
MWQIDRRSYQRFLERTQGTWICLKFDPWQHLVDACPREGVLVPRSGAVRRITTLLSSTTTSSDDFVASRLPAARSLAVGVTLVVGVAALTGCGSKSTSGSPAAVASKMLNVDIATPPGSIDPAAVCSLEDIGLVSDLYVTLLKHGVAKGPADAQSEDPTKLTPYLAASWTESKGGTVYTFRLRSDAKFPSGAPVDAAAVKWSAERAMRIGSCGSTYWQGGVPGTVKSISAPGPRTVVFTLKHPSADFLQGVTSPGAAVVDRTVVEKHGTTADSQDRWLASNFAGSGPYVLKAYVPGNSLSYVANPTFFGTRPRTPQVNITFVTSDPTMLLRARQGRADISLGLAKQSVASLKTNVSVKVANLPAAAWQLIGFPTQVPPFNNAKYRAALTYAVPQQELLKRVAYGYGNTYYGPFPPAFAAYKADLEKPRPYDMAKAKQLLIESGVKGTIRFPIYVREGLNDQKQIATIMQDAWKPLGLELTVKQLSAAGYNEAVSAKKKTAPIVRLDGPSILTPSWLLSYDATCASLFNQSNYCNKKVDALYEKGSTTTDESVRQKYWDEVTQLWVADSPRALLYSQNATPVLQKDITHYVFGQNDILFHLWGR